MRALHAGTWFTASKEDPDDHDHVIHTTIGARQGCPCGAMIFNIIYGFVIRRIRGKLVALGLVEEIEYGADTAPWHTHNSDQHEKLQATLKAEVEYVDDSAFLFDADTPQRLWDKTALAIDVVVETCNEFGMTVNTSRGKTEVTTQLFG